MAKEENENYLYEYISGVTEEFIFACEEAGVDLLTEDFTLVSYKDKNSRFALAGTVDISPEEYMLMAQYGIEYDTRYFSFSTQPHSPLFP